MILKLIFSIFFSATIFQACYPLLYANIVPFVNSAVLVSNMLKLSKTVQT